MTARPAGPHRPVPSGRSSRPGPQAGRRRARLSLLPALSLVCLSLLLLAVPRVWAQATVNEDDRAALKALYTATDGANWTTNTNWDTIDTATDLEPLHGIAVDGATGRVTLIELPSNNLTGSLPDLSALTSLINAQLETNKLTGPIPALPASLTGLTLHNNQLTGMIPTLPTGLITLWLYNNQLSGMIPALPTGLTTLYLHDNQLNGTIPTLPTGLVDLRLHNNQLSGMIPNLSSLSSLNVLTLHKNQLSGMIPNLSSLTNLQHVFLHYNNLSGSIPTLPTGLIQLGLHNNKLSGMIPTTLGSLSSLTRLGLFGNAGLYGYPSGLAAKTSLELLAPGNGDPVCLPSTMGGNDCTTPTKVDQLRLTVSPTRSPTRIDVTWVPPDPAPSGYVVEYNDSLITGWFATNVSINGTTAAITGLTTGNLYRVRVRPDSADTPWLRAEVTLAPPPLSVVATPACGSTVTDTSVQPSYALRLTPAPAATTYVESRPVSAEARGWRSPSLSIDTSGSSGRETRNPFAHLRNVFAGFEGFEFRLANDHDVTARCTWQFEDGDGGGGGGGFGPGGFGGGGAPRTRVPSEPLNLTAEADDGQVVLTWDAPEDDGGSAITDYEYRNVGRDPWTSTGSSDTTYTVTDLVNGTTYVFEVRAVNRNGKSFPSRRAEATPLEPEKITLDFPHFANGGGVTSEVVLLNVGDTPVRPVLYFSDQQGEPIIADSVVDVTDDFEVQDDGGLTIRTAIEPLGELTVATHGRGEEVSGSVRVVAEGPIGGVLRYRVPGVGVTGVGTGTPVRDALFPARSKQGGIRTAAAMRNLGEEAIEVTCRLLSGGVALEEVEIALEANGQRSWFIEEAFAMTDTTDFSGTVRCTATGEGEYAGLAVEVDQVKRIFTTLPVVAVDRTGGSDGETVLDFPHFANGTWVTDLVFVNPSIEASSPPISPFHPVILASRPEIYFHDTGGALVPPASLVDLTGDLEVTEDGALTVRAAMEPLGVLTISTHGRGELVTGSVRVVSEGPLGGMLRFAHPSLGAAGVGAGRAVSDALVPARRTDGGINTGIALHNLESSAGLVTCELLRQGVLRDTASIPLAANGQTSWSIDQAFPATDTSDFTGSLRCRAPEGDLFTAVALEIDHAARTFTTLPVVPVSEMPSRE